MADSFEIGEVALVVLAAGASYDSVDKPLTQYIGEEVEITSSIQPNLFATGGFVYEVCHGSGKVFFATPSSLRKKKPPQEQKSWAAEQLKKNWQPQNSEVTQNA